MTRPLHVGIDMTALEAGRSSGTTWYLYRLVEALIRHASAPRLTLVAAVPTGTPADAHLASLHALAPERVRVLTGRFARGHLGIRGGETWNPWHPTTRALVGPVDLFHASDFVWPRPDGTPQVLSVLDLTTRLVPEHHFWPNRFRHWRKLRWGLRHAHRFQVISAATGHDLSIHLGVPRDRIDVIPLARAHAPGVVTAEAIQAVRARYGLGAREIILCTGTIEPRKNGPRLIAAFDRIAAAHPNVALVFAGGPGWKRQAFDEALRTVTHHDRIHRVGFVSDEALAALYATATVFAYPSLYEGFGLPVLEAMAAGVPVLTSDVSSLPEVAGDAALLCDPISVESIAEGLRQLLTDQALRSQLIARGRVRDAAFTWDRTADLTIRSYHHAVAGS